MLSLLSTHNLANRTSTILARHGLSPNASKSVLATLAHAAEERARGFVEEVVQCARARRDAGRNHFETVPAGEGGLAGRMEAERTEEERTLADAARARAKKKKADATEGDETPATPEEATRRRELASLKKARGARVRQHALLEREARAIRKRRRRRPMAVKGLPPVGTSVGTTRAVDDGKTETAERTATAPTVTLADALHAAEVDANFRHSALLWKWDARLGAPRPCE